MSGESVLAFFRSTKSDPYKERFEIESDRRLFGCMGSGSMFGMALAVYALSIQFIPVPGPLAIDRGDPEAPDWERRPPKRDRIIIKPLDDYHGRIRDKRIAKHPVKPGQNGHEGAKPKAVKPVEKDPGVLVANVIGSLTGKSGLTAYDLIPKSVRGVDLDKLEQVGMLTRTGETRLSGRLGAQSNAYNEGYLQEGTGNGDRREITLPGIPDAPIPTEIKQPKKILPPVEIDHFQNTTTRSTASILAVIRSRSPGLRHIYNNFLKARPGLAGKVTLRFAIAPSGQVVDVGLAGSTTSAPDFDAQVARAVLAWRFEPVKAAGNDLVTVPFNFSE